MLAAGTTVAYFPDTGRTIRVTTDPDHLLAVATTPSPIGRDWAACARLRCQPIGFIDHRWAVPSFTPIAPEARCGSEAAAWAKLARKGLDAYYHVLKGYELDPGDGIIANPDPAWVDDEPATALLRGRWGAGVGVLQPPFCYLSAGSSRK